MKGDAGPGAAYNNVMTHQWHPTRAGATKRGTTPAWLAPEVFRGKPVTQRSDVYSYGVICWELMSGHTLG